MAKELLLDCSSFSRDPVYEPRELIRILLNEYDSRVAQALEEFGPAEQSAVEAFADLVDTIRTVAMDSKRLQRERDSLMTQHLKPPDQMGIEDLRKLIDDRDKMLKIFSRSDKIATEFGEKIDHAARELPPLFHAIDEAHEIGVSSRKVIVLANWLLRAATATFLLIDVGLAASADLLLSSSLEHFFEIKLPQYGRVASILALAILGAVAAAPLMEKFRNSIYWSVFDKLCKRLNSATKDLDRLRSDAAQAAQNYAE